jgi:hypothetical protein
MGVLTFFSGTLIGIIGFLLFLLSWFASILHYKARWKKTSIGYFIKISGGMGIGLMMVAYFVLIY